MQYFLLLGIFETLFLTALILSKRNKHIHDYYLSIYFFFTGLTIFFTYLDFYNRTNNYPYPAFLSLNIPFIIIQGPLIWFYIKSLTDQHFKFKPIYLLHFVPFITVFIEHYITIYSLPVGLKIYVDKTEIFRTWLIYPIIVYAIAIFTFLYLFWGWVLIKKYTRRIHNYFSNDNQINLKWLTMLIIIKMFYNAINDLTYILDLFVHFPHYSFLQLISFMIASIFMLILGFYGHRQGNIFSSNNVELDLSKTSKPLTVIAKVQKEDDIFVSSLVLFMKDKKPYLKPDLTIAALSRELIVSPYYLSDILNNKLNLNFYDFINHYRVEEFKQRLTKPGNEKLSFSGIAFDCGFNSKATFYRVFKKTTGYSPNEYYKGLSRN
jgi:AraC-like DNA-binding protein